MSNDILIGYTPKLKTYQQLWRELSKEKKPASALPTPKVKSQEDSVKWSMELQKTLDKKVQKTGHTYDDVRKEFTTGSNQFVSAIYPNLTRTHWGLAKVNMFIRASGLDRDGLLIIPEEQDILEAQKDVEENGLFFDFDTPDELFLDKNIEVSVINFD